MKKLLFYLVCDLHIDDDSGGRVESSLEDIFQDMLGDKIDTLIIAGDIFNFRKAQSLTTLLTWKRILLTARYHKITVIVIPGNHDKMNYESELSYLDVFDDSLARVCSTTQELNLSKNLDVWVIPFFKEGEVYQNHLSKVSEGINSMILITHIAVNGVLNNDRSEVVDGVSKVSLGGFEKVFIGHYHNRQEFGNIVYPGSIMQRNFGEDQFKGYTKVYDDASYEFVDKEYLVYETVKLVYSDKIADDLKKLSTYDLNEKLHVRVVVKGTREEIDSLKKLESMKSLQDGGFILKSDYTIIEEIGAEEAEQFTPFNKKSISKEWDQFAKLNNFSISLGKKYLKEAL